MEGFCMYIQLFVISFEEICHKAEYLSQILFSNVCYVRDRAYYFPVSVVHREVLDIIIIRCYTFHASSSSTSSICTDLSSWSNRFSSSNSRC